VGNLLIAVFIAALAAVLAWASMPLLWWHVFSRGFYVPIVAMGARYGPLAGVLAGVTVSLVCALLAGWRGSGDFVWFSLLTPDFALAGLLGSKLQMFWTHGWQSHFGSDPDPWLVPPRIEQLQIDGTLDPLASIEGAAGLLADDTTPATVRRELARIISTECGHLSAGIASLLQQSIRRSSQVIPADISALIDSAVREFQFLLCRTGIAVSAEVSGDLPEIECDPDLVRSLLISLLMRTVQSAPAIDSVAISARNEQGGIVLEITGSGRSTLMHLARAAIYRFGSRARTVNVGLATLYEIVRLHDGKIEASLNLRKGLDFSVWLPLRRNYSNAGWQGAGGRG
jgi:hypothetical protein